MALASKKTGTIHSFTGDEKDKLKDFYDNGYLDMLSEMGDAHPELAALAYQIQNLSDDVDSLRQFSGSEEKGRIDANTTNITVANGNIITNAADITTNRNNIPPIGVKLPAGYTFGVEATLVPPAKGAKKATIALTWTVTDTNGKTPITYTGTQTLI